MSGQLLCKNLYSKFNNRYIVETVFNDLEIKMLIKYIKDALPIISASSHFFLVEKQFLSDLRELEYMLDRPKKD